MASSTRNYSNRSTSNSDSFDVKLASISTRLDILLSLKEDFVVLKKLLNEVAFTSNDQDLNKEDTNDNSQKVEDDQTKPVLDIKLKTDDADLKIGDLLDTVGNSPKVVEDRSEQALSKAVSPLLEPNTEEVLCENLSTEGDRLKHVLGVQLKIGEGAQIKTGDGIQLKIGVGDQLKIEDLETTQEGMKLLRTHLEIWVDPIDVFVILRNRGNPTTQMIAFLLDTRLHLRPVKGQNSATFEWLIAWYNNPIRLEDKSFIRPEVLIRLHLINGSTHLGQTDLGSITLT